MLIYGLPVLRENAERITQKGNILELARNLFSTLEVEGGILFIDRITGIRKATLAFNPHYASSL